MTDSDPSDTFEIFGITLSECQACGQAMVGEKPTCNECVGKVPIEELEALVQEWESEHERNKTSESDVVASSAITLGKCAQELQEVIETYE